MIARKTKHGIIPLYLKSSYATKIILIGVQIYLKLKRLNIYLPFWRVNGHRGFSVTSFKIHCRFNMRANHFLSLLDTTFFTS